MSDQSPPPKPKPGSLRDRIAAFEKSSTTSAPVPPPTRPKPAGGASWKPKSPSPPSSPRSTADNEKKPGSMSASDAKESIGRGGSLRERMAALQGRGGFGAPAPPVAPKPVEKPKWKPPPVVSPPVDEEDSEAHSRKSVEVDKPGEVATKDQDVDTSATVVEGVSQDEKPEDDEGHKKDADPEEEERQRRAAIAARIARLGGARVGMGPPVFGKPIPAKKPSLPLQEEVASEVPKKVEEPIASPPVVEEPAPSSTEPESNTPADEPAPKEVTEQAESLSPPDVSSPPHSRSPTSMPIPAVPRRAAPPRRKGAKSPAPPVEEHADTPEVPSEVAQQLNQETVDTIAPVEASGASLQHETEDVSLTTKESIAELPATPDTAQAEPFTTPKPPADDTVNEPPSGEPKSPEEESPETEQVAIPVPDDAISAQSPSFDQGLPHESEGHPEEAPAPERAIIAQPEAKEQERATSSEVQSEEASDDKKEDEEDEVARRARVAARLAKMGAVNPFAPPPLRRDSHDAVSPTVATSGQQAGGVKDTPLEAAPSSPPRHKAELPETEEIPSSPSSPQLSGSPPSILPVVPKVVDAEEDDVHSSVDDETKGISDLTQSPAPPLERELIPSSIHEPSDEVEHYDEDSTNVKQIPESLTSAPLNGNQELEEIPPPPPRHSRHSLPPPRRVLSEEPTEDDDVDCEEHVAYDTVNSQPAGPPIHPHRYIPSIPVDDGLPPPTRLPPRRVANDDDDEVVHLPQSHSAQEVSQGTPIRSSSISSGYSADLAGEAPPKPYPLRSVPPLRTSQVQPISDEPQTPSQASQPDDEALPTVPRFSPSHDGDDEQSDLLPSPPHKYKDENEETEVISPVPPPRSFRPPQDVSDVSDLNTSVPDREVLDESEGDPIDPSFHSPISPKSSSINLRSEKSLEAIAPVVQLDDEQLKRHTIAERMAKLGGIRLGGAPPSMRKPPPTPKEDGTPDPVTEETPAEVITEEAEEEDEQARRQRILARLAGSGGMRLGMLPSSLPQHNPAPPRRQSEELPVPPPARRVSHAPVDPRSDDAETPPPPPPHRILHPTRSSPPVETDSEQDSQTFSDDGVKVEAEESELEEVSHEDAEAPPPIPVRIGRYPSIDSTNTVRDPPARKASLPPAGRPPVPKVNLTTRRTSGDSGYQVRPTPPPQSDYVMVEESTSEPEEVPPPPPPRIGSRPPAPSRHVPQPPATEGTDLTVSQWELPSIPPTAIDFGGDEPDLSLSNWSEDSTAFVSPPSAAPLATPPHTARSESHFPSAEDRPRTSDELIAVWGRVGVQICEVATTLFEKSKKALIGDGTYPGFLHAVLSEVPNAAPPRVPLDYGVVIYVQVANAVQKRLADIMPGDVIFLQDVKLKGHKGLQTYHQSVGTDEPVVGVVSDFEAKKSKVRVFQANQHVGQQTVESVSYRLEDVKSGVVKVFRVLEV